VLAKLKCETTLQSASCSLETTCLVGRFTCMGIVGLKRKELAPADHTVVEKQFTKWSDHWTPLWWFKQITTDTIWYPTDTRHDTSPICHIGCTFAHANSHVFQQEWTSNLLVVAGCNMEWLTQEPASRQLTSKCCTQQCCLWLKNWCHIWPHCWQTDSTKDWCHQGKLQLAASWCFERNFKGHWMRNSHPSLPAAWGWACHCKWCGQTEA